MELPVRVTLVCFAFGLAFSEVAKLHAGDRYVKDIANFDCLDEQFQCKTSRKCISRDLVRNRRFNCGVNDTSDEDFHLLRCHSDEFRCRVNGQCLPRTSINNLIGLCTDFSDLRGIRDLPCRSSTEFRCSEGLCIKRTKVRSRITECFRSSKDEDFETEWSCNRNEFRCPKTGRCIPRYKVRDRLRDCPSGIDEDSSSIFANCGESTGEYLCPNDMKRCIPRYKVGDGIPDCDSTRSPDELIGALGYCTDSEFTCYALDARMQNITLRCIPRSWVNDGIEHCPGGIDENVEKFSCRDDEHSCDNGTRCLEKNKVCDAVADCRDCSDEVSSRCSKEIKSKYFMCANNTGLLGETMAATGIVSSHCILRSYYCDGKVDCADGSDELHTGPGFKCRKSQSNGEGVTTCVLPQNLVGDGFIDCADGADERSLSNSSVNKFNCFGTGISIFETQVCDGTFDCPNLVDECFCGDKRQGNIAYDDICANICFGDGSENSPCGVCKTRELLCSSIADEKYDCVPINQICDGEVQCKNGKDEWHCKALVNDVRTQIEERNYSTISCPHQYLTERYTELPSNGSICDGKAECIGLVDECNDVCSSRKPFYCALEDKEWCVGNTVPLTPSEICDGIPRCDDGRDEMFCNDTRFSCEVISTLSSRESLVSIPRGQVCDGYAHCKHGIDERECPNHFYCKSGENFVYIERNKVQDGFSDCSDGSDECPDEHVFDDDPISSKSELIDSRLIRVWIYFMMIPALLGNFFVIVTKTFEMVKSNLPRQEGSGIRRCLYFALKPITSRIELRSPKRQSALARCNDVLVLNLAVADLLMGIYLVVLIAKTNEFTTKYCEKDLLWRSSRTCENIGTMALVSAQTSVFILIGLTAYRLLAVHRPLKSMSLRRSRAVIWAVFSWAIGLVIAWIPRRHELQDYYVSRMWLSYKNNDGVQILQLPYQGVDKQFLSNFLDKICTLDMTSNNGSVCQHVGKDWESLIGSAVTILPSLVRKAEFGYYSSYAVCLPSFFSSDQISLAGSFYSCTLLTFNFVACIFIAVCYLKIGFEARRRQTAMRGPQSGRFEGNNTSLSQLPTRNTQVNNRQSITPEPKKKTNKNGSRYKRMNKNIARLVMINCLCWIPTCIIGFVAQSGIVMPGWTYSLVAVVLLPVNSAADPFIYSDALHDVIELMRKTQKRVRKRLSDSFLRKEPEIAEMQQCPFLPPGDDSKQGQPDSVVKSRERSARKSPPSEMKPPEEASPDEITDGVRTAKVPHIIVDTIGKIFSSASTGSAKSPTEKKNSFNLALESSSMIRTQSTALTTLSARTSQRSSDSSLKTPSLLNEHSL